MSIKAKLFKGTLALTMGELLGYSASFFRNMILARMLTKADFGIAAAFALVVSMLEFTSKLAIGQLVVQDKDGDKEQFIATAHTVQLIIALFSAFLMLILGGLLASFLNLSCDHWALQSLALIPLFKGLEHLDVRRFGRELRFIPASLVEVIPQVLITLAAYPLALCLKDYRTVLVLLLTKGAITCIGSHYFAERRYRWYFEMVYIQRIFHFGWPLIINSLLMVAIFQGDQFLVGRYYSMADLAVYAAASTLTLAPGMILTNVLCSTMLPVMAQVQDQSLVYNHRYRLCVQTISAASASYSLFMIIDGELLMRFVYGNKYAGGGTLLAWLAAANGMRLIRFAPAIAALAKADTKNQMNSNVFRAIALFPAFLAAITRQPVWTIAATGILGEILAFILSFYRLGQRDGIPWSCSIFPASIAFVSIAFAGFLIQLGAHTWPWFITVPVSSLLSLISGLIVVICFSESRNQCHILFDNVGARIRALTNTVFGRTISPY